MPQRLRLFGCPFDPVTWDEAIAVCLGWCRGERRPRTLVTLNAALIVMMRRDPELARACAAGDLIVADGVSVVWASRVMGRRLPARLAGVDLMTRLLELASRERLRVFFLGAQPSVVQSLVDRCARDYPGVVVAGFRDGYFKPESGPEVIAQVRDARPDMLFVGMPSPFKEVWCEVNRHALGVPLIMGVGGSFDVLAGRIRRAPRWLQALGMEWSWRLMMEPRKMWKRYLVTNAVFIAMTASSVVRRILGVERA
jgi:N-acetylglucosaminyldiphosphoundecaprenol N-acetyl-beta-D-mannosaminyltransferase